MWYTFSDYDKHGENKMITETKEDLETLTRKKERKLKMPSKKISSN